MRFKNDKYDVFANSFLAGASVSHQCKLKPCPDFTPALLRPALASTALTLHCVYTLPTNGQFFPQTEQKQANGPDPALKQPHSCSGITL